MHTTIWALVGIVEQLCGAIVTISMERWSGTIYSMHTTVWVLWKSRAAVWGRSYYINGTMEWYHSLSQLLSTP